MPAEYLYELTNEKMMDGISQPNIVVTRYEANKKEGFVGINTLGEVVIIHRFYHEVIVAEVPKGATNIAVNWERGCKFDVTIDGNAYFVHRKCFNGQEVVMVFNNIDTDAAMLGFETEDGEPIKWIDGVQPYVEAKCNAIVKFYKSNEIIYAEFKGCYIGTSDSGS